MLKKNAVEETRSVSIKKTEERLLNLVKIQTGSLERAAAAWRLAHEILKETEARLRAGLVSNPVVHGDRPTFAAAPRSHFMALSFLPRDKSITDSRLFFHQSMDRLELSEISTKKWSKYMMANMNEQGRIWAEINLDLNLAKDANTRAEVERHFVVPFLESDNGAVMSRLDILKFHQCTCESPCCSCSF
jgi:hypothetical protein